MKSPRTRSKKKKAKEKGEKKGDRRERRKANGTLTKIAKLETRADERMDDKK